MTAVRLAVCADDFGLDAQVNEAVIVLASVGRVSSVACMVGAPCWRAGAPALRTMDEADVEAGLHLDLTEHPFDPGLRHALPEWILRAYAGTFDRNALRREIATQLDAFTGAMGRAPAFVDGHQYVHQLPGVRDVLLEVLAARGLAPWLRSTRCPPGLHSRKARLVAALGGNGLARSAAAHGLRQNARLLGIYRFDAPADAYLRHVQQWLAMAASGDLLVCHPGAGAPSSAAHAAARRREYQTLAGPEFEALLAQHGIHIEPLVAA